MNITETIEQYGKEFAQYIVDTALIKKKVDCASLRVLMIKHGMVGRSTQTIIGHTSKTGERYGMREDGTYGRYDLPRIKYTVTAQNGRGQQKLFVMWYEDEMNQIIEQLH